MPPAFVLSVLLVGLSGFLFHVVLGRDVRDLFVTLILSLVGFTGGEAVARAVGGDLLRLGEVHAGYALAGAWTLMAVGHWLRRNRRI